MWATANKGKKDSCKNWGSQQIGISGERNGVETKQPRAVSEQRAAMWQRAAEPCSRRTDGRGDHYRLWKRGYHDVKPPTQPQSCPAYYASPAIRASHGRQGYLLLIFTPPNGFGGWVSNVFRTDLLPSANDVVLGRLVIVGAKRTSSRSWTS